jgi:hypothetical protein
MKKDMEWGVPWGKEFDKDKIFRVNDRLKVGSSQVDNIRIICCKDAGCSGQEKTRK